MLDSLNEILTCLQKNIAKTLKKIVKVLDFFAIPKKLLQNL